MGDNRTTTKIIKARRKNASIPPGYKQKVQQLVERRLKNPARLIGVRRMCHAAWRELGHDLSDVNTTLLDATYSMVCDIFEMYGGVLSDFTGHDRTMGTARRKGSKSEWGNACKIYRFPPLKEREK